MVNNIQQEFEDGVKWYEVVNAFWQNPKRVKKAQEHFRHVRMCPECKKRPEWSFGFDHKTQNLFFEIECENYRCEFKTAIRAKTAATAVKRWNALPRGSSGENRR